MHRTLIIFAREPQAGRCKTRLCPPLDAAAAAALYGCFLRDVLAQARRVPGAHVQIAYAPDSTPAFFAELAPELAATPQQGECLGARMDNAFVASFDHRPPSTVHRLPSTVLIGSDIPNLPLDVLCQAFAALEAGADVVLGPADDGGYYLVGLRTPQPRLLREVPMSTPDVLRQTLALADELGLRTSMLPPWYDVDTVAELQRLASDLAAAPAEVAPHTRAWLARAGLAGCGWPYGPASVPASTQSEAR